MASATRKAVSIPDRRQKEKIVDFAPRELRAPFVLRCAAFAVDYIIFILFPVGWLLGSRLLSESASTVSIAPIAWILGIVLTALNFLLLPLWRGQTVGKMLAGITILNLDGTHISAGSLLRRNLLGYLVTGATFGIGFLIAAANNSGRALHDLIGGTVVVRGRKTQKTN